MDYAFKRGHSYLIEWVDPIYLAGQVKDRADDVVPESECRATFGEYLSQADGKVFISIKPRDDSMKNVADIPIKCVLSVVEVGSNIASVLSTLAIVVLFFGLCTSLYFTFNPPQYAIEKVMDTIISNNEIQIESYGQSD